MKNNFGPIQFDFGPMWYTQIWKLRKRPTIQEALEKIKMNYREFAEAKFEDLSEFDEEQAQAELELDIHTAEVKCFDLYWLRDHFNEDTLVDLSLAIAEELYPEKSFEIVEHEDDDVAIVTDSERTIVFDLKNYDKFSAKASLLLVNDEKTAVDAKATAELTAHFEEKNRRLENALNIATEAIRLDDEDNVLKPDFNR